MKKLWAGVSWLSTKAGIDQFAVLEREIYRINSDRLQILDIGAGPGTVWERESILSLANHKSIEVTTFDANIFTGQLTREYSLIKKRLFGKAPDDLIKIPDDSFDVVIAYDLIEHLPKHDGYKLLYQINRITRSTSIIFTPNGFVWQPPSIDNEFNQHVSGWRPADLKSMGWDRIRGHTGLKVNYGPYGIAKTNILPPILRKELYALGTLSVFFFPKLAFSFSAISRQKRRGIDYQY